MAKPSFYIEGIPVFVQILPSSLPNVPNYAMKPRVFVIHETENHDRGADAEMHARYLRNGAGGRQASWHFTVDSNKIYQHLPLDRSCWAAGDGNGEGNRAGINIEHCENSDGDFNKTVENGKALIRWLKTQVGNLPVRPHKYYSSWNKPCPSDLLPIWSQYVASIDKKATTPSVPAKPTPHPVKPGTVSTSNSIVDYLNSIQIDSSVANRKKLAVEYGVANYQPTAAKNLELLDKMRNSQPSRNDDQTYEGGSVVDYLNLIGKKSDYSSRAVLAKQYGISNYTGTAAQNEKLLVLLQGQPPKDASKPLKPGAKVVLSSGSSKYATGQAIPAHVKGKSYTVMQLDSKNKRVLLQEILSWVHCSDVTVAGSAPAVKPSTPAASKPAGGSFVGKRVESIHGGPLRFYNRASWSDKNVAGTITKGYGFPRILSKVTVDGAAQYKVANSKGAVYYITASPKFVKVI